MIDLHLFALNCNESFRIVVDEKEKRAKLCCLTLSILVFYVCLLYTSDAADE